MVEAWKPFPLNNGVLVSSFGRIKGKKGIPSFGTLNRRGYLSRMVPVNGKMKSFLVHRIVMLTFVGPSDLQVNHKNCIKTDNSLENLEYVSPSENIKHAYRNERYPRMIGAKNGQSKFTNEDVIEIKRRLGLGESSSSIARHYGVHWSTICRINRGVHWKHV